MNEIPQMPISNVKCWGPSMWTVLHVLSINHPEHPSNEEQNAVVQLFDSLKVILPCKICRTHFNEIIDKMPPLAGAVGSRDKLVKWVFELHNSINSISNKEEISFKDFIHIYEEKSRTM